MKPFGYSLLLDCFQCQPSSCDNLELHYRFLEELVEILGMTKMSAPIVMHAPSVNGRELYPDKSGVSGWVPLIESGIQIHSIEPTHFTTIDIYSCNKFEPYLVETFIHNTFKPLSISSKFIERGVGYYK